ncbi:uncharacterized protein LOC117171842 [Belonocnema kinseyi]|uniref:uncharacterized protein LOC117171842 n=1 Tax=Belonocnema kinseyi TaxID=2817044 RepID=UPI00143CEF7E|nr:uncharacterized protein LOC117171842 [Belonocnema kinseyi]
MLSSKLVHESCTAKHFLFLEENHKLDSVTTVIIHLRIVASELKMKVDHIFPVLIKILVCISVTNASKETKQTIKKYQIEDGFTSEDFEENSRQSEDPQISTRFQRRKEIDSYGKLEAISENSRSNEIQEEDDNSKTTQKSALVDYVVSNGQENFNVAEDASRMMSVIGSLEESIEDPTENRFIGKNGKNEAKMFSKNKNSKNEIDFNKMLTKVNRKLKKMDEKGPPEGKNESSFISRIEVNIAVDGNEIKNLQTLKMKKKTKKVINPHLGEKKSYFKYKETLKEKEARLNYLKESIYKNY